MNRRLKYLLFLIFVLLSVLFLYRYSPYKIELLGHYDKIWAHRINSVERLQKSLKYFDGIELDLVYVEKENYLDVNHPPDESIQLRFSDYFNNIGDQQPYLWLDIKNLKEGNAHLIFERLCEILSAKDYPINRVLIESRYPESLDIFTKAGFMTSYYLPNGLHKMGENEFQKEIAKVIRVLRKQPKIGISSSYRDYEIMNKYFPDKKKYLWIVGSFIRKNYPLITTVLDDKNVKVVLSTHRTILGNR